MAECKISGLTLTDLKQIVDERGGVFHYLKASSPSYKGFGEAYYSKINQNIIKGWKLHHIVHQNFCVPFGAVKLVVFDDRPGSATQGLFDEIILDDSASYRMLSMPPGLWYSFKCISSGFALMANIIDHQHTPNESENLALVNSVINYEWE